jgi:hypothetical protein
MLERAPYFVVALLCVGLMLAIPLGNAGASKRGHSKVAAKSAGSTKSAGYYSEHPCALITQRQVESEFGVPFGSGQATPSAGLGSCEYDSTTPSGVYSNGRDIVFSFLGSSAAFSSGGGKIHKLPSLGHGAFCDANGNLEADVPDIEGLPEHLEIQNAGTCAQLASLARDAFARLK